MISTIDWDALVTVLWASCAAGIGVTVSYGLAILGVTRAVELGRSGRTPEAAVYGMIGLCGALGVLAAIAFGILVLIE